MLHLEKCDYLIVTHNFRIMILAIFTVNFTRYRLDVHLKFVKPLFGTGKILGKGRRNHFRIRNPYLDWIENEKLTQS